MAVALEKLLLSRELEAFERVGERVEEMGGQLEAMEKQDQSIPGEIEEAVKGEVVRRIAEWTDARVGGTASSQGEGTQDAEGDGGSPPSKAVQGYESLGDHD